MTERVGFGFYKCNIDEITTDLLGLGIYYFELFKLLTRCLTIILQDHITKIATNKLYENAKVYLQHKKSKLCIQMFF